MLAAEPLSDYAAMSQKHMFLICCSNAGLQDICCYSLQTYCSESSNGFCSDVGSKQNILHRVGGIREVDHQGKFL
jgi:hypothetical protein